MGERARDSVASFRCIIEALLVSMRKRPTDVTRKPRTTFNQRYWRGKSRSPVCTVAQLHSESVSAGVEHALKQKPEGAELVSWRCSHFESKVPYRFTVQNENADPKQN